MSFFSSFSVAEPKSTSPLPTDPNVSSDSSRFQNPDTPSLIFQPRDNEQDEFLYQLIEKKVMDAHFILDEKFEHISTPKLSSSILQRIRDFLETPRRFPIKTKTDEFFIEISLKEIDLFLREKSTKLKAPLQSLQIVGSMVPFFLGREYFEECVKIWMQNSTADEKDEQAEVLSAMLRCLDLSLPHDIDLRSRFPLNTSTKADITNQLYSELVNYLAGKIPRKTIPHQDLLFLIRSQVFSFVSSVHTQDKQKKGQTQYLLVDFAKSDGISIEWLFIHSLGREFLFGFQDAKLDVGPILLDPNAEITARGNFRKGHQAIADKLGKILRVSDPLTVNKNGFIRLIAAISKGYRCPNAETAKILWQITLEAKRPHSTLVQYLETILHEFVRNHHENCPKMRIAMLFNASLFLQESTESAVIKDLWANFTEQERDHTHTPSSLWLRIPSIIKLPGITFTDVSALIQLFALNALLTPLMQDPQKTCYYLTKHEEKPVIQLSSDGITLLIPFNPIEALELLEKSRLLQQDSWDTKITEQLATFMHCLQPNYDPTTKRTAPVQTYASHLSQFLPSIEKITSFLNSDITLLSGLEVLLGLHEMHPLANARGLLAKFFPKALHSCPSRSQRDILLKRTGQALSLDITEIAADIAYSEPTFIDTSKMWIRTLAKTKEGSLCQVALHLWKTDAFLLPPLEQIAFTKNLIGDLLPEQGDRAIRICQQLLKEKYLEEEQANSMIKLISDSLSKEPHPALRYRYAKALHKSATSLYTIGYIWIIQELYAHSEYANALDLLTAGIESGKLSVQEQPVRELGASLFTRNEISLEKALEWFKKARAINLRLETLNYEGKQKSFLRLFDQLISQDPTVDEELEEEIYQLLQKMAMEEEEEQSLLRLIEKRQKKLIATGKTDQAFANLETLWIGQMDISEQLNEYLSMFQDFLQRNRLVPALKAIESMLSFAGTGQNPERIHKAIGALLKKVCSPPVTEEQIYILRSILKNRHHFIVQVVNHVRFLPLLLSFLEALIAVPKDLEPAIFFLENACRLCLFHSKQNGKISTNSVQNMLERMFRLLKTEKQYKNNRTLLIQNFSLFLKTLDCSESIRDELTLFELVLEGPEKPALSDEDHTQILKLIINSWLGIQLLQIEHSTHASTIEGLAEVHLETAREVHAEEIGYLERCEKVVKQYLTSYNLDRPEQLHTLMRISLLFIEQFLLRNKPKDVLAWIEQYESLPYTYRNDSQNRFLQAKLECIKQLAHCGESIAANGLLEKLFRNNQGLHGDILNLYKELPDAIIEINPKLNADIFLHKGSHLERYISDMRMKEKATAIAVALLSFESEKNLIQAALLLKTYECLHVHPWEVILKKAVKVQNPKIVQSIWHHWQGFNKTHVAQGTIQTGYSSCWEAALALLLVLKSKKQSYTNELEASIPSLLLTLQAENDDTECQKNLCDQLALLVGDASKYPELLERILSLPPAKDSLLLLKLACTSKNIDLFMQGCSLLVHFVNKNSEAEFEKVLTLYSEYLREGNELTYNNTENQKINNVIIHLINHTEKLFTNHACFYRLFVIFSDYKEIPILFRVVSLATYYARTADAFTQKDAPVVFEKFIRNLSRSEHLTYIRSAELLYRTKIVSELFSSNQKAAIESHFIIKKIDYLEIQFDKHQALAIMHQYLAALPLLQIDFKIHEPCMEKMCSLLLKTHIKYEFADLYEQAWESIYGALSQNAESSFTFRYKLIKAFLNMPTNWEERHAKLLQYFGEKLKELYVDCPEKKDKLVDLIEDFILLAYSRDENEYRWAMQYSTGLLGFAAAQGGFQHAPCRYVGLLILMLGQDRALTPVAPKKALCDSLEYIAGRLFKAGTRKSIEYALSLLRRTQMALLTHHPSSLCIIYNQMFEAFSTHPFLSISEKPIYQSIDAILTENILIQSNTSSPQEVPEYCFNFVYVWYCKILEAINKEIIEGRSDLPKGQITENSGSTAEHDLNALRSTDTENPYLEHTKTLYTMMKFLTKRIDEAVEQGVFYKRARKLNLLLNSITNCIGNLTALNTSRDNFLKQTLLGILYTLMNLIRKRKNETSPVEFAKEQSYLLKNWYFSLIASYNITAMEIVLSALKVTLVKQPEEKLVSEDYFPLLADLIKVLCYLLNKEIMAGNSAFVEALLIEYGSVIYQLIANPLCQSTVSNMQFQNRAKLMTLWITQLLTIRQGNIPETAALFFAKEHLKAARSNSIPSIYAKAPKELEEAKHALAFFENMPIPDLSFPSTL